MCLPGGVFCFLQLHHKSCVALGVLHVMFKREFPLSVYNLNILLEGLCKNLEYGKTVILLREVRLSSPASDAVSYMNVIKAYARGNSWRKHWNC